MSYTVRYINYPAKLHSSIAVMIFTQLSKRWCVVMLGARPGWGRQGECPSAEWA